MALLDGVRALFPFSKQQEALKSLPTISPEEAGGAGDSSAGKQRWKMISKTLKKQKRFTPPIALAAVYLTAADFFSHIFVFPPRLWMTSRCDATVGWVLDAFRNNLLQILFGSRALHFSQISGAFWLFAKDYKR